MLLLLLLLLLLVFQENPLGFFTTVFLECFHFSPLFFSCFHFVIAFFSGRQLSLLLFVRCTFFMSPTFFGAFCQVLRFCVVVRACYGFEKEIFILKRVLPYSLSPHLAQHAFIKASLGPSSSSLKASDLPLNFETQTRPICLFESHSVQLKVLVGRFYLCVKALRNTISTLNPHFNSYIYCIVHVISTWPQKRFMKDDI